MFCQDYLNQTNTARMMDVHEADGIVPSDTEEGNDDSTSSSSSPSSSSSSTMMLFDKPQPLVLELHELKKADHSSVDKQNTIEQKKEKRQSLSLSDKPKKLKKKRKSSNASKVLSNMERQSKVVPEKGVLPTPTAIVDTTKEEFFDAQDTVLPVLDNEPAPDTSSPLAQKDIAPIMEAIAKDINQPIEKDLGQPTAQVTPPWARLVDQSPSPGPEAKLNDNQEKTPTSIQKDMSQTNVKDLSLKHPVDSHRSDKAIKKPVE